MKLSFKDFVGNKAVIELVKLLMHGAENDSSARLPDIAFLGSAGQLTTD